MFAAFALLAETAPVSRTDPDALMAAYRARTTLADPDCRVTLSDDLQNRDIVVCAHRQSARLPLPDERGPPDGPYRPVGEARTDPGPPTGPPPKGSLLSAPMLLFKIARKIIDPDR